MSKHSADHHKVSTSEDVALNNPANDDVLAFDSATKKWKNKVAPAGGGSLPSVPSDADDQRYVIGTPDGGGNWSAQPATRLATSADASADPATFAHIESFGTTGLALDAGSKLAGGSSGGSTLGHEVVIPTNPTLDAGPFFPRGHAGNSALPMVSGNDVFAVPVRFSKTMALKVGLAVTVPSGATGTLKFAHWKGRQDGTFRLENMVQYHEVVNPSSSYIVDADQMQVEAGVTYWFACNHVGGSSGTPGSIFTAYTMRLTEQLGPINGMNVGYLWLGPDARRLAGYASGTWGNIASNQSYPDVEPRGTYTVPGYFAGA